MFFFSPDDFDVIHNFYFFQAAEWLIFYCVLGMGITNLCIYIYYIYVYIYIIYMYIYIIYMYIIHIYKLDRQKFISFKGEISR